MKVIFLIHNVSIESLLKYPVLIKGYLPGNKKSIYGISGFFLSQVSLQVLFNYNPNSANYY